VEIEIVKKSIALPLSAVFKRGRLMDVFEGGD
jgi:hypothetical protein